MKVLFINTVYGKGSTGTIISSIGKKIEDEGGQFRVIYGRNFCSQDSHSYFVGNRLSASLHAAMSRLTDGSGRFSSHETKLAINYIRKFDPDIIHLHNLHGYYLDLKILFDFLRNEYKGKIVWTLHDCWAFTGHCVHFSYVDCDRWKNGCFGCPQKTEYPSSFIDNSRNNYLRKKAMFTGLKNLSIVCVSEWLNRVTRESLLNEYPITTIYNGVDPLIFHPVQSDIKKRLNIEEFKMILSVSDGWNSRKGFDRILSLAKHAPDDWKFVIIGLNKQQISIMPQNIIGLERTWNQKELVEYYSAADVFFNPSYEETFGLVTVEAMLCNTPVLVFDKTASPELVKNNHMGLILPAESTDSEIIAGLMKAFKLNQIREYAFSFSKENCINQYFALYKNIMS